MSLNWFTCMTCRVSLSSGEHQRSHYKDSWHSYNLKRKLSQLPPVSHQHYQRIEELHENQNNVIKDQNQGFYCHSCHKQYSNENAFKQHIQSKRHQSLAKSTDTSDKSDDKTEDKTEVKAEDNVIAVKPEAMDEIEDNDSDWESVDSDGDEAIPPEECLFCGKTDDTIEDNLSHMSETHSFFIPDIEYLKDMKGLITYLGEKVGFGHLCLWCCDSGRQFRSRRAAQQHMTDRGHTKMNYSDNYLVEYSDYYDYTSSYPDFDPKEGKADEEIAIPNLDDEDWQLTLPSGAVIGHRSLFRYYKQNLKPLTEKSDKSYSKSSAILEKVMSRYRALGWTGISGELALQRAKDIKFVQRIQRRFDLKLGQKNNKILQKHFRRQN